MASGKNKHERAMVESLRNVAHGINSPFACGGTLVPKRQVAILFPDKTQITVSRAERLYEQEEVLRKLIARCQPASFGKGRKTIYNRSVRDALQIKAETGAFSVLNFNPAEAGILRKIRRQLTPQLPDPPIAELYNLNIYARDGHFLPHKDTPRGSDMLGTLVVCLPSQFSNGALALRHRGILQTYDWGTAISEQTEPTRIHWAAFFGDVDHQIERVWGGLRVTLTYLLRYPTDVRSAAAPAQVLPLNSLIRQKFRELLADARFLAKGGTLAFPCSHLYHEDARFQRKQRPLSRQTAASLKGRDHEIAAAALAEGLNVTLYPYMVENCVDDTWQLEHFPTPREQASLGYQMDPWDLKNALAIVEEGGERAEDLDVIWVDPPPHFNFAPTMYPNGDIAGDPDLPALAHLHSCEFSATGYFGNEGSDIDLYVYAALHVEIPPYGEGARGVTKTRAVRRATSSSSKGRGDR